MTKKGNKIINNGEKCISVTPEELQSYLDDGWVLGQLPRTKDSKIKGTRYVHLGDEEKQVPPNEIDTYLAKGWTLGRTEKFREKCKNKPQEVRDRISKSVTKYLLEAHKDPNSGWNKDSYHENQSKAQKKLYAEGRKKSWLNMNDSHKEKIGNALKDRIGINKNGKYKCVKRTELQKYLHEGWKLGNDPSNLTILATKKYLTHKLNKSFNTSKDEEDLYKSLLEEYKSKTILRQYKDDRYPYYCDFYVVEDDLFIELNAHWTHGGMPYDPEDETCKNQLLLWEEKAKSSKFYLQAIDTWTVRDVNKLTTARKNNLNYKVIY